MLQFDRISTDFHMHTTFSPDAHDSPAEMCRQALSLGLKAIAITDHVEWQPGAGQQPDFDHYFHELEACRAVYGSLGLQVFSGVELGNPHEHLHEARALLAKYPFDIVIASVHWIDGKNIHELGCFADRDPYAVYERYFTQMAEMATALPFDILAHSDRIFWSGVRMYGPPDLARVEGAARRAMAAAADHGRVLELNTSYLTHTPAWHDALVALLQWFREAGGEHVVVNSDAHRSGDIARHQALATTLLDRGGFSGVSPCARWPQPRRHLLAAAD